MHLGRPRLSAARAPTRSRSPAGGRCSRCRAARADEVEPGLAAFVSAELAISSRRTGRRTCREGVIHADLFPDNVFFLQERLSGLIDFYFACNDLLAYDLAVCLNAWCFEPDGALQRDQGRALLPAYESVRPLAAAERAALPMLARGAALRFLLTRLYDWLTVPPGALVTPKDPLEYLRKLRFHRSVGSAADYGLRHDVRRRARRSSTPTAPARAIPARAAGARSWSSTATRRRCQAATPVTTNNRMELTAAIEALEALKRPCVVELHTDRNISATASRKWIHGWKRNGWKTADKKPVKNVDLWQALDAADRDARGRLALGEAAMPAMT